MFLRIPCSLPGRLEFSSLPSSREDRRNAEECQHGKGNVEAWDALWRRVFTREMHLDRVGSADDQERVIIEADADRVVPRPEVLDEEWIVDDPSSLLSVTQRMLMERKAED